MKNILRLFVLYLFLGNISFAQTTLSAGDIEFRVLRFSDSYWKEFINESSRAYRRENDINVLKPMTKNRASTAKQLYIEIDRNGLIADWECF